MCANKKNNSENSKHSSIDFIPFNKIFDIKVITKASENKIFLDNDIIKVKVTAIPEDGKANKVVVELFSKLLKISKKNVKIISGFTNSCKKIIIEA